MFLLERVAENHQHYRTAIVARKGGTGQPTPQVGCSGPLSSARIFAVLRAPALQSRWLRTLCLPRRLPVSPSCAGDLLPFPSVKDGASPGLALPCSSLPIAKLPTAPSILACPL